MDKWVYFRITKSTFRKINPPVILKLADLLLSSYERKEREERKRTNRAILHPLAPIQTTPSQLGGRSGSLRIFPSKKLVPNEKQNKKDSSIYLIPPYHLHPEDRVPYWEANHTSKPIPFISFTIQSRLKLCRYLVFSLNQHQQPDKNFERDMWITNQWYPNGYTDRWYLFWYGFCSPFSFHLRDLNWMQNVESFGLIHTLFSSLLLFLHPPPLELLHLEAESIQVRRIGSLRMFLSILLASLSSSRNSIGYWRIR